MLKKFFCATFFVAILFLNSVAENVEAADVWIGEDSNGVYWAMGETFVHLRSSEGYSYEYFDIDFKVVSRRGKVTFYHCKMWVDGSYSIDGGATQRPKQYPHPMDRLRSYGFKRAARGE